MSGTAKTEVGVDWRRALCETMEWRSDFHVVDKF